MRPLKCALTRRELRAFALASFDRAERQQRRHVQCDPMWPHATPPRLLAASGYKGVTSNGAKFSAIGPAKYSANADAKQV
eukprot:5066539-Prymnesium_polylepis.1